MNTYANQSVKLLDAQKDVLANTASTTGSEKVDTTTLKGTATAVLTNLGVQEDTTGGRQGSFVTKLQTATDTGFSSVDTLGHFDTISMDTGDTSVAAQAKRLEVDLAECKQYLRTVTEGDTSNDSQCQTSYGVTLHVEDAY